MKQLFALGAAAYNFYAAFFFDLTYSYMLHILM